MSADRSSAHLSTPARKFARSAVNHSPPAFPPTLRWWSRPAEAIAGASAVFLNSRALGNELAAVVDQARREGVTRLVALSAINADDDFSRQPSRFRGDRNKEVEQLAVDSGLQWVSLRPSVFATNFVGMWSAQIRAGDIVRGPYAAASSAPIVESDIAEVAARALLADDLVGQKIPLTGPQSLTNIEMVDIIGAVLGRPLQYQEVPDRPRSSTVRRAGFSARVRRRLYRDAGHNDRSTRRITDGVQQILGRPAQSFEQWVIEHTSIFAD